MACAWESAEGTVRSVCVYKGPTVACDGKRWCPVHAPLLPPKVTIDPPMPLVDALRLAVEFLQCDSGRTNDWDFYARWGLGRPTSAPDHYGVDGFVLAALNAALKHHSKGK